MKEKKEREKLKIVEIFLEKIKIICKYNFFDKRWYNSWKNTKIESRLKLENVRFKIYVEPKFDRNCLIFGSKEKKEKKEKKEGMRKEKLLSRVVYRFKNPWWTRKILGTTGRKNGRKTRVENGNKKAAKGRVKLFWINTSPVFCARRKRRRNFPPPSLVTTVVNVSKKN